MTPALLPIAMLIVAYLAGSISSAIVVCHLMRLPDPRSEGSRNPGATNVLRIGGKKAAFITLVGDMLKGLIPVVIARSLPDFPVIFLAGCGLAALLGHIFPLFFKFQGGKGVATGLGVVLGWNPLVFVMTGLIWLIMAKLSRYSSLSALTAFALAPLVFFLLGDSLWLVGANGLMTLTLFLTHHENLARLIQGTEKRIGEKPAST